MEEKVCFPVRMHYRLVWEVPGSRCGAPQQPGLSRGDPRTGTSLGTRGPSTSTGGYSCKSAYNVQNRNYWLYNVA